MTDKEAAERLEAAWAELLKFGQHDGECDNSAICAVCQRPQAACTLHITATNQRIDIMNAAVDAALRRLRRAP